MQAQFSRVFIPRDDYPYLLRYLTKRFGEVVRTGNDFWKGPELVASVLPSNDILFPGKSVFAPEVVPIQKIINEEKNYRTIKVSKFLHFCPTCSSFLLSTIKMVQHNFDGKVWHRVLPVYEYAYTKHVRVIPPLEQRKGWMTREQLIKAFSKYVCPKEAERMADLRIIAYKEGIPFSIEEMVHGKANIPNIVYERYAAYRDELEARMVPHTRTKKVFTGKPIISTQARSRAIQSQQHTITYGFVNWIVKIDGVTLTPEQMIEVALKLGLPIDNGDCANVNIDNCANTNTDKDVVEVVKDVVNDDQFNSEEKALIRRLMKRDKKFASAVRKDLSRYKPSWKAHKGQKSIRYAEQEDETNDEGVVEESPEQEKQEFLEKFKLKPTEIVYEKEGLIKASRNIKTKFGNWTVKIFNTAFYPQRKHLPGEFGTRAEQIAELISSEINGSIVVAEDKKRGFKSLDVTDGRYTVRITSKALSPPRDEKDAAISR